MKKNINIKCSVGPQPKPDTVRQTNSSSTKAGTKTFSVGPKTSPSLPKIDKK